MKTLKAVLIDPEALTVTDITITSELQSYCDVIGCQMIEHLPIISSPLEGHTDDTVTIYVDEEGLFKEELYAWWIRSYPQQIVGKAVVIGHDGQGGSCDCPLSAEQVKRNVAFAGVAFQKTA